MARRRGYAVAVSSGTAALHLGVRAMGWGEGDEVITSPLSFVATSNSLLYERATPVFCDIDPVTFNIDPEAAAAAVGDATAGILPVHIFGYPADLPALSRVASDSGLGILEDAAQALGAVDRNGQKIGASGNLAVFAFYANKQMTTGEGGVLITPDKGVAERAVSERNQGRAPDPNEVEHDRMGFNYRLSDLQAAIGIAQVERLDELLNARDNVAALYRERLTQLGAAPAGEDENHDIVLPCENNGDERRGWFVFVVQLPKRDRPRRRDLLARGIRASPRRPTCPASTCCRRTGSGSALWAGNSRSRSASRSAPWRCRSSPR